jgi:hypothetical protein
MAREPEDRTFQTDTPQANRSAEQGNGVGQRELQVMKDPGEEIDRDDLLAADDAMEEPGLQTGRTHTNRPDRTEALRGQGPKTLKANRERVKGNPDFNP